MVGRSEYIGPLVPVVLSWLEALGVLLLLLLCWMRVRRWTRSFAATFSVVTPGNTPLSGAFGGSGQSIKVWGVPCLAAACLSVTLLLPPGVGSN